MNRRELIGAMAAIPVVTSVNADVNAQEDITTSAAKKRPKGEVGLNLALRYAFTAWVLVDPPLILGPTHQGERRIINIVGGRFNGPTISGEVLTGGADWQIVRSADGAALLEARYTLRTDDGELIYVNNIGIRRGPPEILKRLAAGENVDPSLYYFRTSPRFEASAAKYQWLVDSIFVACGKREQSTVIIDFFRLT
jgi:hypothetical protein